jgi:endonuclease/exonuclease/phosphatase family metal-dependent hydrolase
MLWWFLFVAIVSLVLAGITVWKGWLRWIDPVSSRYEGWQHHFMNPTSIHILSHNLFMLPWNPSNEESLDAWMEHCLTHDISIICLQEMYGTGQQHLSRLIQRAQERGYINWSVPTPIPWCSTTMLDSGLVILSRFPLDVVHFIPWQESIYADRFCAKGFQHAVLRVQDKVMHVFNVHIQSDYQLEDDDALRIQSRQILQLWHYIAYHTSREEVIVIAGDLNINAIQWSQDCQVEDKRINSTYSLLRRLFGAFQDTLGDPPLVTSSYSVYDRCTGKEVDPEWWETKSNEFDLVRLPRRVDHLWVRLRQGRVTPARVQWIPGCTSDHASVSCRIWLKDQE